MVLASVIVGAALLQGCAYPVPMPMPMAMPSVPASYRVLFNWDSAVLTDQARQTIREAAAASSSSRIELDGHTDTSGPQRYNQVLSMRRARAVAVELVRDGVPLAAINIQGYGETQPLVPTGDGVREPLNRRVEIILQPTVAQAAPPAYLPIPIPMPVPMPVPVPYAYGYPAFVAPPVVFGYRGWGYGYGYRGYGYRGYGYRSYGRR
jgi:hypothetical protein